MEHSWMAKVEMWFGCCNSLRFVPLVLRTRLKSAVPCTAVDDFFTNFREINRIRNVWANGYKGRSTHSRPRVEWASRRR